MEPIQLTVQSLSEQVITTQLHATLVLYPDYLHYSISFYCRELSDKTGVWEDDIYRDYSTELIKEGVIGTTVSRSHEEDKWFIQIRTTAISLEHYCQDEQEARYLAKIIREWRLSN